MSRVLWPKAETARPYEVSQLPMPARPRPGSSPKPVDQFGIREAQHPRRCIGPDGELPDGVIYWCLSCNRRVENYNQPFCSRQHQKQRETYVRDLRRAEAKPVKVARGDLRTVHQSANDLLVLKDNLVNAKTSEERRRAVGALFSAIDDLAHFVHANMPTGEVVVRPRPSGE